MKPGSRLGQFELIAALGAGGMGEVFRARDTRLNREVAVKVLPKDFTSDADRLRRFEQEAKTLAALNHPNIMTVFDAGQHEGAPYLVSELLEGRTLREELAAGALSTRKATDYALQMAQGLAAAHGRGVVHRDLKPDNVFVTRDGRVKILDFGLAKLREVRGSASPTAGPADPDAPTVEHPAAGPTEPGRVMGTPSYMAPEQVRGEAVDHRADLFAFGCVLYEMVSGHRPFRRDTSIATMAAILDDEPPDLTAAKPDLPPALTRIVHRCLEKAPERRFQSASDLTFALEMTREQSGPMRCDPLHDPARPWLRWRTVAGLAVLALFAIRIGWWSLQSSKQAESLPDASTASAVSNLPPATPSAAALQSIAVLPFVNLSADKENEYFSDGITEEILNALARTPGLRVAARTSAFSFKGKNASIQRIGDMLKVGVLLEGSVRREGKQLRITAQLINVADGFQLWSDTFDRKAEDVFAIQTEVAQRVQEALKVRLLAGGNPGATLAGTDNLEAYDLYLRGRHFWNQRTGADLERAVGLFQQATEKDPKFAAAYAGLGLSHVLLPRYAAVPVREAIPKARKAARRALELDTRLAEAHTVLGLCTQYDWDLAGAKREYQAALNLNPNHATSHHWNAWPLRIEGKLGQALAEIRQAQALDPLSAVIQKDAGELLHFSGRYDDALVEVDKALSLSPDFLPAYGARGRIFLAQQRVPEAIAEFEKVWKRTGDSPFALGNLGLAYARAGRTNEARRILEKLKLISEQGGNASDEIALVHIGMGELGQAFASLERGAESRDVDPRSWKSEPLLVEVIKDPRYSALLQKFGLDK